MNLFAYRNPRKARIFAACSETVIPGFVNDSFVISPFTGGKSSVLSIPIERIIKYKDIDRYLEAEYSRPQNATYKFPEESTPRESHEAMVENIVADIKSGILQKCVAARTIVKEGKVSVSKTFENLCKSYPDAFVFMFHTEESGTWIGASPELLLSDINGKIESMSLAGTRPSYSMVYWTKKEIDEQQVVTSFIADTFRKCGIEPSYRSPKLLVAGPVEHLMTKIKGYSEDIDAALNLVTELSPTPALGGFPRAQALETIKNYETFDRGYYGGYCGWYNEKDQFSFYLNLRSVRVEPDRYCIVVGGGIMRDSDPTSEWLETEQKAHTVGDKICFAE